MERIKLHVPCHQGLTALKAIEGSGVVTSRGATPEGRTWFEVATTDGEGVLAAVEAVGVKADVEVLDTLFRVSVNRLVVAVGADGDCEAHYEYLRRNVKAPVTLTLSDSYGTVLRRELPIAGNQDKDKGKLCGTSSSRR